MFQDNIQMPKCTMTGKRTFLTSILSAIIWAWFFGAVSMGTVQHPPIGTITKEASNTLVSYTISLSLTIGVIAAIIGFLMPIIIWLYIRNKPDENRNFSKQTYINRLSPEFRIEPDWDQPFGYNPNDYNSQKTSVPGFMKNVPFKRLIPITILSIITGALFTTLIIQFLAPTTIQFNSFILRAVLGAGFGLFAICIVYYIFFGLCRRDVKISSKCSRCGKTMNIIESDATFDTRSISNTQGCFQCSACGRITCYDCSDNRYPCECGAQQWVEKRYY